MTTRRALVTGGSRGIGAAVVRALAAQGHRVVFSYRSDAASAEAVVASTGAPERVRGIAFDVTDAEAVQAAYAELDIVEDPFQILVNNAGVARDVTFAAMKPDAWSTVLDTTLGGFFHVTQPLVLPMAMSRWGRIVNLSSVAARRGNRGQVNYAAAKAGIVGATRSLALELAKRRITVNAVSPGLIDTAMLAEAPVERMLKDIPAKRLGTPEEVAALVTFLCSEEAAYITGQVIGIDGGLTP